MSSTGWVFAVATALSVGMRCFLKLGFVDSRTGFYEGAGILPTLFLLLLAAGGAGIFLGWIHHEKMGPSHPLKRSIPLGWTAILLGLAVEFSSYQATGDILRKIGGVNTHATFPILSVFFGCLTGLIFLVLGGMFLTGRGALNVVVLMAPVLWTLTYLVGHFTAYTSLRSISDQQLAVTFFLLLTLFFMSHGGYFSQIRMDHYGRVVVLGYLCAMLAFTLVVPNLLGAALGRFPLQGILRTADELVILICGIYCLLLSAQLERGVPVMGWVAKPGVPAEDSSPPSEG